MDIIWVLGTIMPVQALPRQPLLNVCEHSCQFFLEFVTSIFNGFLNAFNIHKLGNPQFQALCGKNTTQGIDFCKLCAT
jgi:hypothetical protein